MPLPIETERLIIRRFVTEDLDDEMEYMSDPEVARYEYWEPYTREDAEREADALSEVEPGTEGGWLELAVELKSVRKVIGNIAIKVLSRQHRFGETGWTLNRGYQGRGFATEAARAILDFGFDELDLYWVIAFCDVRNAPSYRLMARLGMRRLSEFQRNKFAKGKWLDEVVYSITVDEWREGGGGSP